MILSVGSWSAYHLNNNCKFGDNTEGEYPDVLLRVHTHTHQ